MRLAERGRLAGLLLCLGSGCAQAPGNPPPPSPAVPPLPIAVPPTPAAPPAGFRATQRPLTEAEKSAMLNVSWREGCPVPLDALVRMELRHRTVEGGEATGVLVVASTAAPAMERAFARLHEVGFPIVRMEPIEAFGGDDDASMAANNTSAFNCRARYGGGRFSRHAWGEAIDVNPLWNPLVKADNRAAEGLRVAPESARPWSDRTRVEAGSLFPGSLAVAAFTDQGWVWGGTWRSLKDWQHFSADGT